MSSDTPPDLQSIRALARGAALNRRLEDVEAALQQLRAAIEQVPDQVRIELQELAAQLEALLAKQRNDQRRPAPTLRLRLFGQFVALAAAFGAGAVLQVCPPRPTPRNPSGPIENPDRDKQAPERPGALSRPCPPFYIPGEDPGCRSHDRDETEVEDLHAFPDLVPRQNGMRR